MTWLRRISRAGLLAMAISLPVAALLPFGSPLAQTPDATDGRPQSRISAVVGEEIISAGEVEARTDLLVATGGLPRDETTRSRLRPQILRGLIDEALQRQEAVRLEVQAKPADIDRALEDIAQRNNTTVDGLMQLVERSGGTPQSLRRQIEAQIGWLRIINRELRPRARVTEAQIDAAFAEATRAAADDEVRLARIVLPVYQPDQEDSVRRDAAEIIRQVRGGGSFDALARQFSTVGGDSDLGWMSQAALPPELRRELARLEPGGVTPPLRTAGGIQVVQLVDRRPAAPVDSEGVPRVRLSQILFPVEGGQAALTRAQQQARAVRPQITDCAGLNSVARRLGAPASGDLGWLRLSELPPELARVLARLPIGQVSEPVRGPAGVQLLMVCERAGRFERPAPPTRDSVKQRLEQDQIERLAARYLRDLREDAFIDLRDAGAQSPQP